MPDINLMPISGINTESEDKALRSTGDSPRHFVRDAVNVDVTASGEIEVRPGTRKVTDTEYRYLWQSPLHGDTFAVLGDDWVKIDPATWSHIVLAHIGGGPATHAVLNNRVVVAARAGIFVYDGTEAKRLTLDTPAAPMVSAGAAGTGSLHPGLYGVAVSWLRDGQESAVSELTQIDVPANGSLEITFPMSLDLSVNGIRLYMTGPDGGELRREQDYPVGHGTLAITAMPDLGAAATFRHLSPMPTGNTLHYWRGRLITSSANVLRFSESMAYHLHDERYGFILMPQRITFVQPVEGGIWVGQVDHVAFVQGTSPDQMAVSRKAAGAPVPGSAILVSPDAIGLDLAGGGSGAALWLASNGYVVGTSEGQLVELHRGVIDGVTGQQSTSVELERRIITTVV